MNIKFVLKGFFIYILIIIFMILACLLSNYFIIVYLGSIISNIYIYLSIYEGLLFGTVLFYAFMMNYSSTIK